MVRKRHTEAQGLELTRFNAAEVRWMNALNEIAASEKLSGFPMSEKGLYADPRWLQEYEAGLTVRQAILRYKEDNSPG
jgi:hypothetical protein